MSEFVKASIPAEQMLWTRDVAEALRFMLRLSPNCVIPEIVFQRPDESDLAWSHGGYVESVSRSVSYARRRPVAQPPSWISAWLSRAARAEGRRRRGLAECPVQRLDLSIASTVGN